MKAALLWLQLEKLSQAITSPRFASALLHHGVLAGSEHRAVLSRDLAVIVDIGANRGQFSLASREWAPGASIVAFEPLPGPAAVFRSVFRSDERVMLHEAAIGPKKERRGMHVSKRDDSSSLLPISALQSRLLPGTEEAATVDVMTGPLDAFVLADALQKPAMLKLDVQGYEYEALLGCLPLLCRFQRIYCECSFVELYSGQRLAADVIALLADHGFLLAGAHNPSYDEAGQCIQADLLFVPRPAKL